VTLARRTYIVINAVEHPIITQLTFQPGQVQERRSDLLHLHSKSAVSHGTVEIEHTAKIYTGTSLLGSDLYVVLCNNGVCRYANKDNCCLS
jgi:hypothetical protein